VEIPSSRVVRGAASRTSGSSCRSSKAISSSSASMRRAIDRSANFAACIGRRSSPVEGRSRRQRGLAADRVAAGQLFAQLLRGGHDQIAKERPVAHPLERLDRLEVIEDARLDPAIAACGRQPLLLLAVKLLNGALELALAVEALSQPRGRLGNVLGDLEAQGPALTLRFGPLAPKVPQLVVKPVVTLAIGGKSAHVPDLLGRVTSSSATTTPL
jgi:hypothetical protein